MSGGGAGKVYFVLYLAVVLELLIIIVERDEAEEHLQQKQRETMRIVESILSQLQSGAGTEGINTRPQDEITLKPDDVTEEDIGFKVIEDRKYVIEVGVTDISHDLIRKEGESEKDFFERLRKLVKLGNVQDLEYQIFYTPGADQEEHIAPDFPSDAYIESNNIDFSQFQPGQQFSDDQGNTWQFMARHKLVLDEDKTYDRLDVNKLSMDNFVPVYPKETMLKESIGSQYLPEGVSPDSFFYYSAEETQRLISKSKAGDLKKRSFVVNFQPDRSQGGWYKLRFRSKTNRILGVRGGLEYPKVDDETKVNIGTVTLSVKDLRKVHKQLYTRLEAFKPPDAEILTKSAPDIDSKRASLQKFDKLLKEAIDRAKEDEDATTYVGNLNLYGYIVKLLAPGMSEDFDQNKGGIEFNIRVIKPQIKTVEPSIGLPNDIVRAFEKDKAAFIMDIGPYKHDGSNDVKGQVFKNGSPVPGATITCTPYAVFKNGTVSDADENRSIKYVAIVDVPLSPGQYTYTITHDLKGKGISKDSTIIIYDAALSNQSALRVSGDIDRNAKYGKSIFFAAVPKSEGIAPNNFNIFILKNGENLGQQTSPYIRGGLDIPADNKFSITCDMTKVTAKIIYKNPITENQIEIFSHDTDVELDRPRIYFNNKKVSFKQKNMDELSVEIDQIKVKAPETGCEDKSASLNISVDGSGEVTATDRETNTKVAYTYTLKYSSDKQKEGSYNVRITAKLKRKSKEPINRMVRSLSLKGSIDYTVRATATNNDSPVKVEAKSNKKDNVSIKNFKIERDM